MDFQEFLRFVPKLIDARLPAFDAHIKMAPLERLESLRNSSFGDKKPRMAAVMMLFYPKNNSTHLVLIVRMKAFIRHKLPFRAGNANSKMRILPVQLCEKLMRR